MFASVFNQLKSHSLVHRVYGYFALNRLFLRAEMHSVPQTHTWNNMRVFVLPALSDNYMYLLVDKATNEAAAIDPVEPETILKAVKDEDLYLTTILTTHHHWDHAGGNSDLIAKMKGHQVAVYGGDERIQNLTKLVKDGDEFKLGSLTIRCLHTPCHTSGHICYHVISDDRNVVFTGDTLFVAGCGKFFEGDGKQMHAALNEKLAKLPNSTKVYCGHEYTLTNVKFALTVEPLSENLINKLEVVQFLRKTNEITVPSTIDEELKINPFMRLNEVDVQQFAKATDPIQVMTNLRQQKDAFKPT